MKKFIAILAIGMLLTVPAYATSATAPDLATPLSASATASIDVLDAFYLIVSPDEVDVDVEDNGTVQSEGISVTAGSGATDDWHITAQSSLYEDVTNAANTFDPSEPGVFKLIFYPALDANEEDMGDVLGDYDESNNGNIMPVAAEVAVYRPKLTNKKGVHACYGLIYGNMPSATTGTYEGTMTFKMIAGAPA